jgi:hypothetical protein
MLAGLACYLALSMKAADQDSVLLLKIVTYVSIRV